MKILVTGGVGFVGTALIKKLVKEGHSVFSIDDYSIGTIRNEIKGCDYHIGDVVNDLPSDNKDSISSNLSLTKVS